MKIDKEILKMIYLDNAATSFPKPLEVYDEVYRCMKAYCANPGRGSHEMAIISGEAVLDARETIGNFLGIADPLRLCFTKNATEALNIAIKGILKENDHVIISGMEHNSVVRPLKSLEIDRMIELTILECDKYGRIDPEDIKRSLRPSTKLIVCTMSSNVNGTIMPFEDIGKIASENGVIFLLDASQGIGSEYINASSAGFDMIAFPGHKGLMGPQGTGGLYVRDGIYLQTIMEGGTGSNSENMFQPDFMPDRLESGTINTPGIVGLKYGVEYINTIGINTVRDHKHMLIKNLYDGISQFQDVKIYSTVEVGSNSGIVAANFGERDSNEISYILNKNYNIATRAGFHCAPLAHKTIGTLKRGVVRFSVGYFNTVEEIDCVINALKEII